MWMPRYLDLYDKEIFLRITMLMSSTCLEVLATYDHVIPKVRFGQAASFDPQWSSGVNHALTVLAWNFVIATDIVS